MENTFGQRLKELRLNAGMTQKQLADRVGISKSIVSFYELHERQATGDILIKLAAVFHVSVDYLLGTDPVPRLDVSGLTDEEVTSLQTLVDGLRRNRK